MSAADLTRATAAELAGMLASGEVSSVDATQAHLDRYLSDHRPEP